MSAEIWQETHITKQTITKRGRINDMYLSRVLNLARFGTNGAEIRISEGGPQKFPLLKKFPI